MKYSKQTQSSAVQIMQRDARRVRSMVSRAFLVMLTLFAVINFFAILCIQFHPESSIQASPSGFLEACRELCVRYGLVETGHVAEDTKAFLTAARSEAETSDPAIQDSQ